MNKIKYFYNVDDKIDFNTFNYLIVDRTYEIKNNRKIKKYLCRCSICKDEVWKEEKYLKRIFSAPSDKQPVSCNNCKGRMRVKKENRGCVADTHPWIMDYFLNKDDAYDVSHGSGQYKDFKCPICGDIKHLSVKQVVRDRKINCQRCDDGYSYPNKIGLLLLEQLPVEKLKVEFHDSWTDNRRYDFSFYLNNVHYLLEMDGDLHYNPGFNSDIKIIQQNDNYKNRLAEENGCILIRIDCRKSEIDYIKTNVEKSLLNNLFDLSHVNWDKIAKDCVKSKMLEVCSFYMNNKDVKLQLIANNFNISTYTVIKYLKTGREINLTDYKTHKEISDEMHPKIIKLRASGKSVNEISELLSVKPHVVYTHLKKEGVKNAA